jgi:chorismate mutase
MDIADWRRKIDELDRQLVSLMNQRAKCAAEIGMLKRNLDMPVYEPDRERIIFENIAHNNGGPLSNMQLRQIYERLVDVMRQIQGEEMTPGGAKGSVKSESKETESYEEFKPNP